jgi:hypothetical protein
VGVSTSRKSDSFGIPTGRPAGVNCRLTPVSRPIWVADVIARSGSVSMPGESTPSPGVPKHVRYLAWMLPIES